jgi:predicted alpha/beta superfamily hydrolase
VGGADKFIRFIQEEVMPFTEKDYKKTPYRVITGHSMSAFLVMHAFLQYPKWFNAYIASDPAMVINKDAYLNIADSIIKNATERNNVLFLSAFGNSDSWARFYAGKMDSLLQNKKLSGLSYRYLHYPDETHFSVFLNHIMTGFILFFKWIPLKLVNCRHKFHISNI